MIDHITGRKLIDLENRIEKIEDDLEEFMEDVNKRIEMIIYLLNDDIIDEEISNGGI